MARYLTIENDLVSGRGEPAPRGRAVSVLVSGAWSSCEGRGDFGKVADNVQASPYEMFARAGLPRPRACSLRNSSWV